ncbi:hypothetical protein [Halomonas sp. hl-4]|uniref:hypothetical protein n=1 Tax=Halomonas sp. hl-4 TaxID=1761789 RepID=UPI000BB8F35D|nr:hypothetical protein [Halomonas sp. hl-4]SNY95529.1 hypothetical protein SAMN04488142_0029 [Halomonas sp. hl-4]
MNRKTLSALAIAVLFAAFAMASSDDYAEEERKLMRYCERVVDYHADKAMGVPIEQRRGNKDHRGIAAEQCPGMKPAR